MIEKEERLYILGRDWLIILAFFFFIWAYYQNRPYNSNYIEYSGVEKPLQS